MWGHQRHIGVKSDLPKTIFPHPRYRKAHIKGSGQQNVPKKMKITQSPQIVNLEEEEPKEKMSMEMVESRTKNEEANTKSMPQGESSSRISAARNMSLIRHLGQSTNPKKI
jgi:hypothetical protein